MTKDKGPMDEERKVSTIGHNVSSGELKCSPEY